MIDLTTFQLFLVTCGVLVVTPGPDTLFVVAQSIERGRKVGVISVLGICCGFFVHTLAAAIGLSALLLSSALAFNAVKYMGAVYLIYLGVRTLISREQYLSSAEQPILKLSRIFSRGFITNVLNPKVAIFFLAFIPQFVDPARGSVMAQIAIFGLTDMCMCLLWLSFVALIAGTMRQWLTHTTQFWHIQKWVTGSIFVALGGRLLFVQRTAR